MNQKIEEIVEVIKKLRYRLGGLSFFDFNTKKQLENDIKRFESMIFPILLEASSYNTYLNELEKYELELKNTPFTAFKRKEELNGHIRRKKLELNGYLNRIQNEANGIIQGKPTPIPNYQNDE